MSTEKVVDEDHEEIKKILVEHRDLINMNTKMIKDHLGVEEVFQAKVIKGLEDLAPVQQIVEDAAVLGRWLNVFKKVILWVTIVGGAIASFFIGIYEYLEHLGKIK